MNEATVAAYVDELRSARDDDGRPALRAGVDRARGRGGALVPPLLRRGGLLASTRARTSASPRVPQGIPKALARRRSTALLARGHRRRAARAPRPRDARDALRGGLRISELVGLDLGDLDLDDGLVRVFGKGAKERVMPIGRTARAALGDYLADVVGPRSTRRRGAWPSRAVFLNARGGRLTRQGGG